MTTAIELAYPVSVSGIETNELYMRRPRVRDMLVGEKKNKSDAEKEILLFANLCEVDPEVIESLDMQDYGKLQQAYQDFLS